VIIVFYGIGMNNNSEPDNFLVLLIIINALYFCSASYGLFYSALIPKLEIAMALVPVLIIPFMMLSGFFRDLDQVSKIFYPLEYLSPFRYGFQACMLNEFHGKPYRAKLEDSYIPHTL
jgi:ABC-type multidrug transport system permease subunit